MPTAGLAACGMSQFRNLSRFAIPLHSRIHQRGISAIVDSIKVTRAIATDISGNQDSSVYLVTGLQRGWSRVRILAGPRDIFGLRIVQTSPVTHPVPILCVLGLFQGGNASRCETWSLALREERRLSVFENRVLRRIFGPKRDEVTEEWRKLHNEELNRLKPNDPYMGRIVPLTSKRCILYIYSTNIGTEYFT